MNTNTRKTFFLVEGGKAASAAQDAKFDGFNNVLVYARTAFEARVIAEAYTDGQIGIDNVEADNGKDVISAVFAPSQDTLNEWIANYGKTILAADLLEVVADKGCVEVTADLFLQSAETILAEWPANTRFAEAPFWITYGQCPLLSTPVSDAEDPELVGLVSENSEKVAKLIESHQADKVNAQLLELVKEKGCIQVTTGVYVQTAQNLIAEQITWGPEDLSADSDFSVAPFWITTDSGDDPVPVEDSEDSELAALVAENAEEITKIIEYHSTDGIVLCEVDPSSMTFAVVEEAQPQPKKIEPTIIYHHGHPWAVVKTDEHSLEVSLSRLYYSEECKPYLLCCQNTEHGPKALRLYLI